MLPTRVKVLVPLLFFGAAFAGKRVYDKRRKKEKWPLHERLEDGFKRIEDLPEILALRSNILSPVSDKVHRLELAKRYWQLVSVDAENNNSVDLVTIKKMRQGKLDDVQVFTSEWLNAVIGQQQLACEALSTILAKSAFCKPENQKIRQKLGEAFSLEPMLLPELCLLPNLDPRLLEEASNAVYDADEERLVYGVNDKRNIILALGELWMTTIQRKESASSSHLGYPPIDDYGFSNPTSDWDPLTDPTMTLKSTRAMLRSMNDAVHFEGSGRDSNRRMTCRQLGFI
ncbi:Protein SERAC1 [Galdieria sulphuraria]|nr:Protein SERAC1 [Galdieria sulphuraria]